MRLIASALMLVSFSAFAACPDLSGTYATCRSSTGATSGAIDMVVTQSNMANISVYKVTSTDPETHQRESEVFTADGKTVVNEEVDPNSGMRFSLSQRATCSATALTVESKASIQGTPIADLKTVVSKSGNILTIVTTGVTAEGPVNETELCE